MVEFVIVRTVAKIAHWYYEKYDKQGKENALRVEAILYKKMANVDIEPRFLEDHLYIKWGIAVQHCIGGCLTFPAAFFGY